MMSRFEPSLAIPPVAALAFQRYPVTVSSLRGLRPGGAICSTPMPAMPSRRMMPVSVLLPWIFWMAPARWIRPKGWLIPEPAMMKLLLRLSEPPGVLGMRWRAAPAATVVYGLTVWTALGFGGVPSDRLFRTVTHPAWMPVPPEYEFAF